MEGVRGQAASVGNQLISINTRFCFALDWQSVFHRKSIASVLQYDNIFGMVKKNKKSIIDCCIKLIINFTVVLWD